MIVVGTSATAVLNSEEADRLNSDFRSELSTVQQTWLTLKNAVPVRLNQLGQDDVNNCLACVAWLAHLAQSQ